MTGRRQVENRWGMDFWRLIADFAYQGLSRFDTARAIGYTEKAFCSLLCRHPSKDPFDPSSKSLAYLRDTGENLREALERMSKEGRSWGYAARVIGYCDGHTLKKAAEHRGIIVEMNSRPPGRPRIHAQPQRRGDLTINWPSWDKIYSMGGPGPMHPRKKKKA